MCFEVNNGTGGLEGVEKSFFWSNKVSGVRQCYSKQYEPLQIKYTS